MEAYNRNAAYDLSAFMDTSPKKRREPQTQPKRKPEKTAQRQTGKKGKIVTLSDEQVDRAVRRKINPFRVAVTGLFGAMIAFLLVVNITGRVVLTELNSKIKVTQADLVEQQSIYTQTELQINSKYSTTTVEQYAREQLGMNKAANNAKEYINMNNSDKAEILETDTPNIFQNLVNSVKEILS